MDVYPSSEGYADVTMKHNVQCHLEQYQSLFKLHKLLYYTTVLYYKLMLHIFSIFNLNNASAS